MEQELKQKFFDELGSFTWWTTSLTFNAVFVTIDMNSCIYLVIMDKATMKNIITFRLKLRAHYVNAKNKSTVSKKDLEVGMIVVAQTSPIRFVRAKVIKIMEDEADRVKVFECDEGIFQILPRSKLYWILPEFLETPFQTRKCKLNGGLDLVVGTKILYDLMKDRSQEFSRMEMQVTALDLTDPQLPGVVLFPNSKHPSFNEIAFEKISNYKPQLSSPEGTMISHVEVDGTVWIQKDTELFRILVSLGLTTKKEASSVEVNEEATEEFDKNIFLSQFWGNQVFFGRYTDGNFYRIYILHAFDNDSRFDVLFMEFGNRETLEYKDIRPCGHFGEDMFFARKIPKQCIAAQLANIGNLDTDRFWNYIDVNTTIITVEVIEDGRDKSAHNAELPLVEVFIWPEGKTGPKVNLNEMLLTDQVAQTEYLLGQLRMS